MYHALFEHASVGIIITNGEGSIEHVNPHASALFGYTTEELAGQTIECLLPARLRNIHVGHRGAYNAHPKSRPMGLGMNLVASKKNGQEFPVEISLAHYEADGRRQIMSFINDITERKKAEDALKTLNAQLEEKIGERTKELSQALLELKFINENLTEEISRRRQHEEATQRALERERELGELKSRFVSMASHEFRTPLSGILSSVSLIERYCDSADVTKRHKHVHTIKNAVRNLTNILNDFLSLDKLEQGKVAHRPSEFPFADCVAALVDEFQALARDGQQIVHTHEGPDATVHLDPEMLRGILTNLLSNATKFSGPAQAVRVNTAAHDDHVTVTVQDHGMGIPGAEQKHLFERFFRAHNAATIPGTGLGLHIVARYLDLMEGTIRFASREHEGTTFTVTLPRKMRPC